MAKKIEKVAVLGAGIMGAQVSAHLANAGIPSLLYDLTQEMAEQGIQNALSARPAAFYNPKYSRQISPCNYDDHMERLSEVDWVIEAVAERLDIKRSLFKKIKPYLRKDTIVSSNTSG
jgi:3-hydroxyacyl-CoA dehydrogenase